jgi:hypothetical protein
LTNKLIFILVWKLERSFEMNENGIEFWMNGLESAQKRAKPGFRLLEMLASPSP